MLDVILALNAGSSTGGISEHAVEASAMVCERLRWLGVELDAAANQCGAGRISTQSSRVEVRVIPTDEYAAALW